MKACFLLQRRFAYIGHKLAIILKDRYDVNEFCGYVCMRSSFEFLRRQKDIKYSSLLLDEDIHNQYKNEPLDLEYLKKLEAEYGLPNLWPYLAVDRVLVFNQLAREYPYSQPKYTHEEMMRMLQVTAKAIIAFLEKEKPDFVLASVVGSLGGTLLYHVAKKKGIPVFICEETRINDDCVITESLYTFTGVDARLAELADQNCDSDKQAQARAYLKNFRAQPASYNQTLGSESRGERLAQLQWLWPPEFYRSLKWFLKISFSYLNNGFTRDYDEGTPLTFAIDRLKRKARSFLGFKKFYEPVKVGEDFAYFPLHFEPEVAISVAAPFWTDQINLIRQIAKSLPVAFKVYVKEHPDMVGYRTRSYYRELKKIPNVKLIDPRLSSFNLVQDAKLILTISGTAGWEALLLQKPVITFGRVFYNRLSMVKLCRTIDELPFLVQEQLKSDPAQAEPELENFIGAILEESVPAGLRDMWYTNPDPQFAQQGLSRLADLLAKKLNLVAKN